MITHLDDARAVYEADRTFHLEMLRGGMNRLLFRSNKSGVWETRVEILFMSVKYLALGTMLQEPRIERIGTVEECVDQIPWLVDFPEGLSVFVVRSRGGAGLLVAGSMSLSESEADAGDPSEFFMMG